MSFENLGENTFKIADEVFKRIFNHKPFLEAQLRSMVKDFEEERNNAEVEQIHHMADSVAHIKDQCIDYIGTNGEKLISFEARVDKIETLMRQLLEVEENKEEERRAVLHQFLNTQNEDLVQFMEGMNRQVNDLDQFYEQAKHQIDLKYCET